MQHDWQLKRFDPPKPIHYPYAWPICTKCGEWKGLVETKCENKINTKEEGEV